MRSGQRQTGAGAHMIALTPASDAMPFFFVRGAWSLVPTRPIHRGGLIACRHDASVGQR